MVFRLQDYQGFHSRNLHLDVKAHQNQYFLLSLTILGLVL